MLVMTTGLLFSLDEDKNLVLLSLSIKSMSQRLVGIFNYIRIKNLSLKTFLILVLVGVVRRVPTQWTTPYTSAALASPAASTTSPFTSFIHTEVEGKINPKKCSSPLSGESPNYLLHLS